MILILSNEDEFTTDEVIEWLLYLRKPFLRISANDTIEIMEISLKNKVIDFILKINGSSIIKFSEISSFWYRRSFININFTKLESNEINNQVNEFLQNEILVITRFLHIMLSDVNKKSIGHFKHNFTNKLENLLIAQKCGLKIPDTIITSNRINLSNFKNNESLITKAASTGFGFNDLHYSINGQTALYKCKYKEEHTCFFPTLFQYNIKKKFEIRAFYLNGEISATAIFSQQNRKTKIDFRNYDDVKPNRVIPYLLPRNIFKKIKKFMEVVDMNTGSIDLIYDKNGDFIFLEVNPIGQFSQVSHPCNYNLEYKIANIL